MNSTIYLLSAVSFIVVAVMTVTGPLLPLIAEEYGVTVGEAGIIVTAFAVPYGACQIIFGPLGDRIGKVRLIAMALAAATVFVLGSGLASSLEGLAVMRFCCGFAMAATVPMAMAYIADEVPYAIRQPVMGRYINGLVLGQIAGGVLGGIAAEYFDWRSIFFVFGLFSAVIAGALWFRAGRERPLSATPPQRIGAVLQLYAALFRARHSRDLIIAGTLEGMLIFGVLAYFGAYLRHTHDLSYVTIGLVLGMYGVGGLIYAAAVFRLVRLLGERRMIVAGTMLLGCCYIALILVPHWIWCLPTFLLAGFGFYLFHNTMQTRATELSASARGTAVSLWVFMLFLGQGAGVILFGAVIDRFGYAPAFVSAGVGIVATGLWFQGRPSGEAHRNAD